MTEFLYILGIIFSFVLVSILLINIRHFFFRGEPLKKTCSSQAGQSCVCEAEGREVKSCESNLPESI